MNFHFYITYYRYYDNVKLKTRHILAVDDLCTSIGTRTTTLVLSYCLLISLALFVIDKGSWSQNRHISSCLTVR